MEGNVNPSIFLWPTNPKTLFHLWINIDYPVALLLLQLLIGHHCPLPEEDDAGGKEDEEVDAGEGGHRSEGGREVFFPRQPRLKPVTIEMYT